MNQHQRPVPKIRRIAPKWKDTLRVLKITVDELDGKAQYPLNDLDSVPIPENKERKKK